MKLHLDHGAASVSISGYGDGFVEIRGRRYTRSLIVTPNQIIDDWPVEQWSSLSASAFEALRAMAPNVVLLGTGAHLRFPAPALTRSLIDAQIGLEVMDTPAACRTFNVLAGEGRNVVAGIIVERGTA